MMKVKPSILENEWTDDKKTSEFQYSWYNLPHHSFQRIDVWSIYIIYYIEKGLFHLTVFTASEIVDNNSILKQVKLIL